MTPEKLSAIIIKPNEIIHYSELREHYYEYSKISQNPTFWPALYPQ